MEAAISEVATGLFAALPSERMDFRRCSGFRPHWRHSFATPAVTFIQECADLRSGDLAHGVVEAHPEHPHEEVSPFM